jgi:uncharacterized membrane protein YhaH (DUF805 family)
MKATPFYLGFGGRITRSQFWLKFVLPVMIVTVSVCLIVRKGVLLNAALTIWVLLLLWPFVAVLAKRWHDRNKSGWWTLIALIPLVGQVWVIIECGCLPASKDFGRARLAQRYNFSRIEADELHRLLAEMRPKQFSSSADLSNCIVRNDLGRKYPNISGVVRMRERGREWDFHGGFPPHIYRRICDLMWLDNEGTKAQPVGFIPFKKILAQRGRLIRRRFWVA